ncbi:MAG: hypothetical protein ACI4U4_02920 [Bacilli bacterium]
MNKRKMLIKEEERIQRKYLVMYLSVIINLHYKYYKNEKFETFQQYINSGVGNIKYSKEEVGDIFREVDSLLEKKYGLFFTHYDLYKLIYIADVLNKEKESVE